MLFLSILNLPGQCLLEKLWDVPAADVDGLSFGRIDFTVDNDPDRRAESAAVHDDARLYLEQLRDRQTFRQQAKPK